VLPPDDYGGSVYLYYAMQAPRERVLGYSTAAPPEAFDTVGRLTAGTANARDLGIAVLVEYEDGVPRRVSLP
jgi:hypothetical protein